MTGQRAKRRQGCRILINLNKHGRELPVLTWSGATKLWNGEMCVSRYDAEGHPSISLAGGGSRMPRLVKFIERLGDSAKKVGWNGLLIGDMAQPRGGPMINGHSSHQIGLDVDIWFKPMPTHVLSREEREMDPAVNVVAPDGLDVDHKVWTPAYMKVVKTAAEDPSVTRIFVNAAIKKEMCSETGTDRSWLAKVRPWWGHSEHFHVRLACPNDPECKGQPPVPTGDGCGHALDSWFRPSILHPPPPKVPP